MDSLRLILCSKSARRKKLIKKLNLPVIIYPVETNEDISVNKPIELVKILALMKARVGTKKFQTGVAIGADTIVVNEGEIIGKPKNTKEAGQMLRNLSGTTHKVYTGVALIDCATGREIADYEVTKVRMRKLTENEIKKFSKKHIDKAGAYAVQEKNDAIIEKINGDYYNVVGLPINKIKVMLKKLRGRRDGVT